MLTGVFEDFHDSTHYQSSFVQVGDFHSSIFKNAVTRYLLEAKVQNVM